MPKISFKQILIAFVIIFLLSRAGKIMNYFADMHYDPILTLEPLRNCSPEARYIVTLLFMALCFVIVWKLLLNKKQGK